MDVKNGHVNDKIPASKSRRRWIVARVVEILTLLTLPAIGSAQVSTNITSSGLGTTITQSGPINDITGGTRRGGNLFHSFGSFDVGTGDTANFLNDTGLATSNIVGRVNGGQTSSVFGTIKTTDFGNANLFLINPFGWIFGSGASLDVGGSFHASTADYIKFPDGAFFADNSPLPANGLTANPLAFGFLGSPLCNSPCISVADGSNLKVPDGQTLSLVGGDVQITGGSTLSAPSGRIQIGSFTSAGEATVDGLNGSFASKGQVAISSSSIDASGVQTFDPDGNLISETPAGTVVIRGGQLVVESSSILAQSYGSEPGAQLGIDVQMDDSITLASGAFLLASTAGVGRGGDIQLIANQVTIDGSGVASASFGGEGVAGNVNVDGTTISLLNGGSIQSVVESITGLGQGGSINVNAAESISMTGASGLFSVANNAGTGGNISISTPSLTMDGGGTTVASLGSFGEGPGGTSGAISINTGSFTLSGGALLNSVVSTTAPGVTAQAGNVTVLVDGAALITGAGTAIVSSASQAAPEDLTVPATIFLQSGSLQLSDGALIQAGTFADNGQGGNVKVQALDSINISSGAGISSQSFNADVGSVEISTKSLNIDRGFINTGTLGVGNAGSISIDVGTLTLTGGGQIASSSGANAAGNGGNISVQATGTINISGSSPVPVLPEPFAGFVQNTSSGIFSTTATVGAGGNISIQAKTLSLTDSGIISAESTGTSDSLGGATPGNAGSVSIVIGDTLHMDNGTITTAAASATGGDITITHTGSLLNLVNSQITTSVNGGDGRGGNITIGAQLDPATLQPQNINPFEFIALNNSGIHANAFGGPGGNINIFSDFLISSLPISTAITASSALSTPGAINIQAIVVDVSKDVAQLPETPLQATELMRAACAARFVGGKASSLVLGNRDGLPLQPGGLMPSPLYLSSKTGTPASTTGYNLPRYSLLQPANPGLSLNRYSLLANSRCS